MPHVDEGQLHAYLDGELTPVERARVDEHVAGCAACRTRLDEERQLIERAGKLLGFAAPVDRPAPPLSGLARPRRWWHVRMPLAWAATVILAIGLGWSLSEQLGRPEVKTMVGPIAVVQSQAPVTQPAAPSATATGRLDVRRTRGFREQPEPTLAQKSPAFHDSNATDALRALSKPAEEQSGAGSVAAPAPAPAAAANAPSRNLAPRMQAAERDEALVPLDSAAVRAILGREPLLIPGLAVRGITRSGRAPNEIVVAQALDSTQEILLFEARQTMVKAFRDRDARLIGDVMVEIQGGVAADSLKKLLGKIKP